MVKKKTKLTPNDCDDALFIGRIDFWPRWPYLPIKRYSKDRSGPECALLLATETPWTAVYVCNLYGMPPTREEFLATKRYEYASVEALLADGWVVD